MVLVQYESDLYKHSERHLLIKTIETFLFKVILKRMKFLTPFTKIAVITDIDNIIFNLQNNRL